jgi:hypothetical protein
MESARPAGSPPPATAGLERVRDGVRRWPPLGRAILDSVALVIAMRVVLGLTVAVSCGDGHCDTQGITWFGPAPATSGWQGLLVGPWQRNDAALYSQIALHGYLPPSSGIGPVGVFFPLFPLLMRAFMTFLGGDSILSGLVVNSVLTAVALTLLFQLVESDFGERAGRRAQLLLGVGPAIFFLLSPLSEAGFLTCTLAAVLAVRRERILLAALLAAGATLSRIQGILVMVPLLIEIGFQARARMAARQRPLRLSHLALVLPPACLLGFQWYVAGHGYPGGILAAEQTYWHAHTVFPGVAVSDSLLWVFSHADVPELLNLLAVVALLVSIVFMWRRLRPSDTAYAVASLLVIVSHVNGFSPLMSALRFSLLTYPVWTLLGRSLPSPQDLRRALVVLGALTLLVAVGISGYHMVQ